MALRKNKEKIDYHIKLLSDSNVVLVEAKGFESEIFVPEILHGRISFQNIINERRCCTACSAGLYKPARAQSGTITTTASRRRLAMLTPTPKVWRMSAGSTSERRPLAVSTPTCRSSGHATLGGRYYPRLCQVSNTSARSVPSPMQVLKNTRIHLDNVMQLTGHQLGSDPSVRRSGISHSGYRLPLTPMITYEDDLDNVNHEYESAQIALQQQQQSPQYSIFKSPKWRKCLTPLRTYSRHGNTAPLGLSSEVEKNDRQLAPLQPIPTYLNNPTQGIRGLPTFTVRRRKLTIDPKTRISPNSFKQQQQQHQLQLLQKLPQMQQPPQQSNQQSQKQQQQQQQEPGQQQKSASTKSLIRSKLANPSKASELNNTPAFDMLTRSNRSRCMALKLQHQFKNNCVNKASATNPKYKILCNIPPLNQQTQLAT